MVSISLSPLLRLLPRLPIAIAVLAFAACSSTEQTTSEIATLEADTSAVGDAAGAITPDDVDSDALSPDEAALEFSQCMRDEGLDFPDLSVDADGNIELRAAFQSVNPGDEGFREAMDGCREILEQTGFGGGGGRGEALESPEIQDALLDFSQCVRDAGYDVGDLTLQGPGAGGGGQGGGNAGAADDGDADAADGEGGRGQRQQGFGNPSARFATGLGLDYEDPDVQKTIDGCAPIVDEAFAAAGIGQGRG